MHIRQVSEGLFPNYGTAHAFASLDVATQNLAMHAHNAFANSMTPLEMISYRCITRRTIHKRMSSCCAKLAFRRMDISLLTE